MTITPEMIHDALEAFHSLPDRSPLYNDMTAALEAVVPHIEATLREQIAAEIRAVAETRYAYAASERTRSINIRKKEPKISHLAMDHAWALSQQADGLSEAARIAEKGLDQ